jgi:hypothetical protein
MIDPTKQLPHDQSEHDELQHLIADLARWFESPTGQAFKTSSEDTGMPGFSMHLLMDTVQSDPGELPMTMTTAFMLGAKFMRQWMIARQSEPLPDLSHISDKYSEGEA